MKNQKQRISVLLFLVAFSAYSLIFSGFQNENALSRMALSLALVEHGDLYIDDFAGLTSDKARAGDHFISDKAPGMSFLALPATAVAVSVLKAVNPEKRWLTQSDPAKTVTLTPEFSLVQQLATVSTASLFTALAVAALFNIALLLGASTTGALLAAIIYGFATPTWAWATTFFGHGASGAFLILGLWVIVKTSLPGVQRTVTSSAMLGLLAGFLLGTAIVIEYPCLVAAIFISFYGLWRLHCLNESRVTLVSVSAIAGGLIAGAPLMLYNTALFGSPFSLSYNYSEWTGMKEGLFGIHAPDPIVAFKLLFSGERGLFWLSPVLILCPLAFWSTAKSHVRAIMFLGMSIFALFLIMNAGFVYWQGGWTTGPRYLTPSLPFLALPFAWLWDRASSIQRLMIGALASLSGIICFAMASIEVYSQWDPDTGFAVHNVVIETLYPKLFAGQFSNLTVSHFGISAALAAASCVGLIAGGLAICCIIARNSVVSDSTTPLILLDQRLHGNG